MLVTLCSAISLAYLAGALGHSLGPSLVLAWGHPGPTRVRKTTLPLNPAAGLFLPPPTLFTDAATQQGSREHLLLLHRLPVLPALGSPLRQQLGAPGSQCGCMIPKVPLTL